MALNGLEVLDHDVHDGIGGGHKGLLQRLAPGAKGDIRRGDLL